MDLVKRKHQRVILQFNHEFLRVSPFTITNFADDTKHGVVWHVLELPQQIGEQTRPAADDFCQVTRDLSREGQKEVGILIENLRQSPGGLL